jgi:hypothetical protein
MFWLPALVLLLAARALATPTDAELLLAFKDSFANGNTLLKDWVGEDPCESNWAYITCRGGRSPRVVGM